MFQDGTITFHVFPCCGFQQHLSGYGLSRNGDGYEHRIAKCHNRDGCVDGADQSDCTAIGKSEEGYNDAEWVLFALHHRQRIARQNRIGTTIRVRNGKEWITIVVDSALPQTIKSLTQSSITAICTMDANTIVIGTEKGEIIVRVCFHLSWVGLR